MTTPRVERADRTLASVLSRPAAEPGADARRPGEHASRAAPLKGAQATPGPAPAESATESHAAAPSVRVHFGRIEIRSTPAAAPAAQPARGRADPHTDYLDTRKRWYP